MFKGVAQYFAGVGRAKRVRSGKGEAHAERLKAYGELNRLEQSIPAARAKVLAPAEAIVSVSVMAEMRTTPWRAR